MTASPEVVIAGAGPDQLRELRTVLTYWFGI